MKLGRRSKLAFHLTLWAMIGVALLSLPAFLSPHGNSVSNLPSRDNGTNPTTLTIATTTSSSNPVTVSYSQPPLDARDFAVKLTLVLALAVVLSSVVMVWSNRRFRELNAVPN